jgi:multiubiquitin
MPTQAAAEHGHEQHTKEFKIYVNTREKTVTSEVLSYEDVVKLAFGVVPTGDGVIVTVVFHHAHQHPAEGTLVAGQSVRIKNKTSFDVEQTNRS